MARLNRAELVSLAALKKARRAQRRKMPVAIKGDPGETRIIREQVPMLVPSAQPQKGDAGADGASIVGFDFEQVDDQMYGIVTLSNGKKLKSKFTLPPMMTRQERSFYVRNNIAGAGVTTGKFTTTETAGPSFSALVGLHIILVDTTAGNVTVSIPEITALGADTSQYIIVKRTNDPNKVLVSAGSSKIDGEDEWAITTQKTSLHLYHGNVTAWGWTVG